MSKSLLIANVPTMFCVGCGTILVVLDKSPLAWGGLFILGLIMACVPSSKQDGEAS